MDKKIKIAVLSGQNTGEICGFQYFMETLEKNNIETAVIPYAPVKGRDIISEIKALHPEMLIAIDLLGFEQCTLTDNIAYNLLDCKQLHLLLHHNLSNEQYLAKQLSIAMFFYCAGNDYYEYLNKQYPEIPYLKALPAWQSETGEKAVEENGKLLYRVFEEVLASIS